MFLYFCKISSRIVINAGFLHEHISHKEDIFMTGQMNENGVSTAGKRTQAQFRRFLVERNMSEQTIKAYSYAVKQFYGYYTRVVHFHCGK